MTNNSNNSGLAETRVHAPGARHMKTMPFMLALSILPGVLCAQTYVQVAELDPSTPIGSRITSTVTQNKLSGRKLFAAIGDKVTFISAVDNPSSPPVYQFASDMGWNRLLFGQKDVYIYGVSQTSQGAFLGPAGIDYGVQLIQGLPVFIADRANERVVIATFDRNAKTLTAAYYTHPDADMSGVNDVAFDGTQRTVGLWYFYVLSVTGRISYWTIQEQYPTGIKLWSYGSTGTGTGQFRVPKGICVGHTAGQTGGSLYTTDFYVADGGNGRLVWLRNGQSGPTWMGAVTVPNGGKPLSCAVDHFGNVTVADSLNSKLVKYTWNLTFLDSYGTYGTGGTNDNTFAHPHAVDVPFGPKADATFGWVWVGDGRVITAEDWGTQSGAREHYLGMNGSITTQPNTNAQFSYFVTDHGSQVVTVVNSNGTAIRTLANDALYSPGSRTLSWDGNSSFGVLAPTGNYTFKVVATSAYSCSGQAWCAKTLVTNAFFHQGPPQPAISGPNTVQEFTTNTWTASASAGIPPYSYQWTIDGSNAGTSTSITAGGSWGGGESHAIVLRATDAAGRVGSTEVDVYVLFPCSTPPDCPPEELSLGARSIRSTMGVGPAVQVLLNASWDVPSMDAADFDVGLSVRSSRTRRAPETSCAPISTSWCLAPTTKTW